MTSTTLTLGTEEDDRGEVVLGELVRGASIRVDRGGIWNYVAGFCRTAHRGPYSPLTRISDTPGFRLARVPVEGK